MSVELAAYRPVEVVSPSLPSAPAALVEWARGAQAAHDLAEALCRTAFCPDAYKGKAGEATAAILAGGEVGFNPIQALNAFDLISGRPAMRAVAMRALVQAQGHEVVLVSQSADRVVMKGRRRDSREWQQVEFTIADARQLGLTGKTNWKNQPKAMLTARATSAICRLVASDALLGVPYTAEELEDLEPGPSVTVARTEVEAPKRMVRRASKPELVEPPLDDEPTVEAEAVEPVKPVESEPVDAVMDDPITEAQSKKLHAALRVVGLTTREEGLAWIGSVLDREVTSSKELTKVEASRVIDALEHEATQPELEATDGD